MIEAQIMIRMYDSFIKRIGKPQYKDCFKPFRNRFTFLYFLHVYRSGGIMKLSGKIKNRIPSEPKLLINHFESYPIRSKLGERGCVSYPSILK